MEKYFIAVVQYSSSIGLGIPVNTKTPSLGLYCRSRYRLSALNFTNGWSGLQVASRLFFLKTF